MRQLLSIAACLLLGVALFDAWQVRKTLWNLEEAHGEHALEYERLEADMYQVSSAVRAQQHLVMPKRGVASSYGKVLYICHNQDGEVYCWAGAQCARWQGTSERGAVGNAVKRGGS